MPNPKSKKTSGKNTFIGFTITKYNAHVFFLLGLFGIIGSTFGIASIVVGMFYVGWFITVYETSLTLFWYNIFFFGFLIFILLLSIRAFTISRRVK